MRFPVILSDPAWRYANRLSGRGRTKFGSGASGKYQTEKTEDMALFRVEDVSAEPSIHLMWCTMPFLKEGIWLLEQWGFQYTTVAFCWVKTLKEPIDGPVTDEAMQRRTRRMPGHYTASNIELALLGWHGSPILPRHKLEYQVIYAPPTEHSHKPPTVHEWIERNYDGPYLELFATEKRAGWCCLGNQIDGQDLRDSLQRLVTV